MNWAMGSGFVLRLRNVFNNVLTLSQAFISWCWVFWEPFPTAGDGATLSGSGWGGRDSWNNWRCALMRCFCLSVCQTCQRWSPTIPILPQRRGGPASQTCPPTHLMKETIPGRADEYSISTGTVLVELRHESVSVCVWQGRVNQNSQSVSHGFPIQSSWRPSGLWAGQSCSTHRGAYR